MSASNELKFETESEVFKTQESINFKEDSRKEQNGLYERLVRYQIIDYVKVLFSENQDLINLLEMKVSCSILKINK